MPPTPQTTFLSAGCLQVTQSCLHAGWCSFREGKFSGPHENCFIKVQKYSTNCIPTICFACNSSEKHNSLCLLGLCSLKTSRGPWLVSGATPARRPTAWWTGHPVQCPGAGGPLAEQLSEDQRCLGRREQPGLGTGAWVPVLVQAPVSPFTSPSLSVCTCRVGLTHPPLRVIGKVQVGHIR